MNNEWEDLRQQLARREAQIVMLREACQVGEDALRKIEIFAARLGASDDDLRMDKLSVFRKALAATDDLSGYILCEKEPVARLLRYIGNDPYPKGKVIARTLDELPSGAYPDTWEETEPLYRAKEQGK